MPFLTDPLLDAGEGRALAEARIEIAVLRSKNAVLAAQVAALREQLAAIESAQRSLRSETSLALRTPLGSIVGYTEILLEEAEERGLETLLPDLRNIRAACDDLLGRVERASMAPRAPDASAPEALVDTMPSPRLMR